jgi:uncharacterized protein
MDLKFAEDFRPITPEEETEIFSNAVELGNYVCRQCNRCLPCPENINIPEVFKYEGYFDRQMANGKVIDPADYALRERLRFWFDNRSLAVKKYAGMDIKADKCTQCGECLAKCPYGIDIVRKLELADYKLAGKKIF